MAEVPLRIPVVAEDAGAVDVLRDIRTAIGDLRESMLQQSAAQKQATETQRKANEELKKTAAAEKAAAAEQKAAAKAQADAIKQVEKAYKSALAPHEKTRELLEEIQALRFEDEESITKQAVAVAHLTLKLEDQTRRFEQNRGAQHKLSRSLAELLEDQTRAQTAAIAAGAALIKEGISSDQLSAALIHLSVSTADADKKTEAYRGEVSKLEQQLREVTAAEKANAAAQQAAAEHYDLTKKKLDAVETAMEGLRIPGAEIVTSLKRMSDSMETANRTLTPMQVNLLKGGIAIGAVGAAGAAAVAGIVAMGAALVANSSAADENNESLREYGLALDEHGTQRVNRAAAALDTFGVVSKAVSVAVADTMAPGMEFAGTRVAALGLMAVDAWKNFAQGKTTLEVITELVAKGMVGAFNTLVSPIKNVALGLALLSDTVGITDDAAINLRNTFNSWTESLESSTADGLQYMVKAGLEPLIAATGDYMGKAEDLVGKQNAINAAMRQGKADVEAYTLSLIDLNLVIDAAPNPYQLRVEQAKAAAAQEMELDRQIAEFRAEQRAAEMQADQAMADARVAQLQSYVTLAQQAGNAAVAIAQLVAGENSRAAKIAFLAQQAAATAGVIVNTALGVTSAMAAPPPATMASKLINAGIVVATGIASAATIASTTIKSVQTRHSGGPVIDTTGWEPGEVPVKARAGEVVVPTDQVRAMGGASEATRQVRSMAQGQAAAPMIVYDRMVIARAVEDDYLANGRTRRAISGNDRYGFRPSRR